MRQIATLVYGVGIIGLFLLNRAPKSKTSSALYLPLLWLLIAGSRNFGEWLYLGAPVDAAALPSDAGDAYLEGNPIDRNLLAGMVALGVIILIRRSPRVSKLLKANLPVLLFFVYCGLSILWSDFAYVGFKRWIRASGDLVMVLVILSERDWLAARKRILAWAGFILVPVSILFIRYYPEFGRAYGRFDYTVSWTGVSSTKNGLGMISMILGLAAASRVLDALRLEKGATRYKLLLAHGTVLAMAVYLIHMANSATSLACFILGSGILVLSTFRFSVRKPVVLHLAVAATLLFAISTLFLDMDSGVLSGLGRNATLTGRTDVWHRALGLVQNPVLGAGFESFWIGPRLVFMRGLDSTINQAHNGYLEIYLNLGWVGAGLLGIMIIKGYGNIMSAFRRDPDPARLRLVYFTVALFYDFTEAAFKMMNPVWILFLLAIIAVPRSIAAETPTSAGRRRRKLRKVAPSQPVAENALATGLHRRAS